jgi:hypothetical protein
MPTELAIELDQWQKRRLKARFWVRDDDAIARTPAFDRLHRLAGTYDLRIGLAVIPARAEQDLIELLRNPKARFMPMCHGLNHTNHGSAARPSEFGADRDFASAARDLRDAFYRHRDQFGAERVVFVPPFNSISPRLAALLPEIGFSGLSSVASVMQCRAARLVSQAAWLPSLPALWPHNNAVGPAFQTDVHVDVIDWRQRTSRPVRDVMRDIVGHLRLRRLGLVAPHVPIGILTHHLVHDQAIWDLCDTLLCDLKSQAAVEMVGAGCAVMGQPQIGKSAIGLA